MNEREALKLLIEASRPFTSGDIVDETSGTIKLMDDLEAAIENAETVLEKDEDA